MSRSHSESRIESVEVTRTPSPTPNRRDWILVKHNARHRESSSAGTTGPSYLRTPQAQKSQTHNRFRESERFCLVFGARQIVAATQ